ncbi:unnamed protein product, partial [Ectocarpus sp. 13 AM-2016]
PFSPTAVVTGSLGPPPSASSSAAIFPSATPSPPPPPSPSESSSTVPLLSTTASPPAASAPCGVAGVVSRSATAPAVSPPASPPAPPVIGPSSTSQESAKGFRSSTKAAVAAVVPCRVAAAGGAGSVLGLEDGWAPAGCWLRRF